MNYREEMDRFARRFMREHEDVHSVNHTLKAEGTRYREIDEDGFTAELVIYAHATSGSMLTEVIRLDEVLYLDATEVSETYDRLSDRWRVHRAKHGHPTWEFTLGQTVTTRIHNEDAIGTDHDEAKIVSFYIGEDDLLDYAEVETEDGELYNVRLPLLRPLGVQSASK